MQTQPPHKKLTVLMAFSAILGLFSGWFFGPLMAEIGWIGELFLRCLKMMIVPLVMSSMVVGIGQVGDIRSLGKMGRWTVFYYCMTTGMAAVLGIVMVSFYQPGLDVDLGIAEMTKGEYAKEPTGISDFFLMLVWPNIFDAMAETKLLPVILFSLIFGALLSMKGEKGRLLLKQVQVINTVILEMVGLIMWLAPIGIFALLSSRIGLAGGGQGILTLLQTLGSFAFVVIGGLLFHAIVVLPLLFWLFTKRSPIDYAYGMMEALLSAFSTASSAATLPLTLTCVTKNNRIKEKVADFVLPLGATLNMDGTALYEAVAALFIAQVYGVDLGGIELILVCLTAILASIGAAGIPDAGLVTMVIVLQAVGLPLEGIGLILSIDWFLDRFRTAVNVWGDAVGAAVIEEQLTDQVFV